MAVQTSLPTLNVPSRFEPTIHSKPSPSPPIPVKPAYLAVSDRLPSPSTQRPNPSPSDTAYRPSPNRTSKPHPGKSSHVGNPEPLKPDRSSNPELSKPYQTGSIQTSIPFRIGSNPHTVPNHSASNRFWQTTPFQAKPLPKPDHSLLFPPRPLQRTAVRREENVREV